MAVKSGQKAPGRDYERTARSRILDALGAKNLSVWEMASVADRAHSTVSRLANKLHSASEIHIADWKVAKVGPHIAIYGLGDFPDAQKPALLSAPEKCKRYRLKRAIPKPKDPILRALLGVRA